MALLTVYEKQGADGVTYRVALGNEATTRGDGGFKRFTLKRSTILPTFTNWG